MSATLQTNAQNVYEVAVKGYHTDVNTDEQLVDNIYHFQITSASPTPPSGAACSAITGAFITQMTSSWAALDVDQLYLRCCHGPSIIQSFRRRICWRGHCLKWR